MTDPQAESDATRLIDALNQAWTKHPEYNLNRLKKFPSAQSILQSPAIVQVAVVRQIVDLFVICARREKNPQSLEWAPGPGFPWGSIYLASSLLKKALPFHGKDFEEMLEGLANVGYITASQFEFITPLIGALEQYAEQHPLSKRLRKICSQFSEVLTGRGMVGWTGSAPIAADRRAAKRIERLLLGPLQLGPD